MSDISDFLLARADETRDEQAEAIRAVVKWHESAVGDEKAGAEFIMRQYARQWAERPDFDPAWI